MTCEQYADGRGAGPREGSAEQRKLRATASLAAAIGAGIGAAVAHNAGKRCAGRRRDRRIDREHGRQWLRAGRHPAALRMAYASCMTSHGNEVAGAPPHRPRWYHRHGYAPPPPPGDADGRRPPPDDQGPPPPPPEQ